MSFRSLSAALGLALLTMPASAQPAQPDMHQQHMQQMQQMQQMQAAPPAGAPAKPSMNPGMMGGGMMGGGMMGGGAMCDMKGGAARGGSGIMSGNHVEGHIAFLKAELGITATQEAEWRSLADALRAAGKQAADMRKAMEEMCPMHQDPTAKPPSFVEQLAEREKRMGERLTSLKAINSALTQLHAKFSPEQKKLADELLPSHMGRGGMMGQSGCGMKR